MCLYTDGFMSDNPPNIVGLLFLIRFVDNKNSKEMFWIVTKATQSYTYCMSAAFIQIRQVA